MYMTIKKEREMTCKDCIHYDVCAVKSKMHTSKEYIRCTAFKDKHKYIELPCKVHAEIFIIIDDIDNPPYVDLGTVESFSIQDDGMWIFATYECGLTYWHKFDNLGRCFWLNPKEAEKALEERKRE